MIFYVIVVVLGHLGFYLWKLNKTLLTTPDEIKKVFPKRWTDEQIEEAYKNVRSAEEVSRPHLRAKKGRRYIVVGGSGVVGSWIVQHLLWRGEAPESIRIFDLNAPTRPEALKLSFLKVDVADRESLKVAYQTSWPSAARELPLTVFHCAAFVRPQDRYGIFFEKYQQVNVDGVAYSMEAAKQAGADCFIATSSSSVAIKPVNFFALPRPSNYVQVMPNAEPLPLDHEFANAYAYSKAMMEAEVRDANSEGFRTGIIRPTHAVYGHGTENQNSVTWANLKKGGGPTWLKPFLCHFVHAINVSLGHLALEDKLLEDASLGGRGFPIAERPIMWQDHYRVLELLAGCKFPPVNAMMLVLLSYLIELYCVMQAYVKWLPAIRGDLNSLQPGMMAMCAAYLMFTDDVTRKDLGFVPAMQTLEGLCMTVKDWEEKRKRGDVKQDDGTELAIPKAA